jgi:hypothetical protein
VKRLLGRLVNWLDNLDAYEMPNRSSEEILELARAFAPEHQPGSIPETVDHLQLRVSEPAGKPTFGSTAFTERNSKS